MPALGLKETEDVFHISQLEKKIGRKSGTHGKEIMTVGKAMNQGTCFLSGLLCSFLWRRDTSYMAIDKICLVLTLMLHI